MSLQYQVQSKQMSAAHREQTTELLDQCKEKKAKWVGLGQGGSSKPPPASLPCPAAKQLPLRQQSCPFQWCWRAYLLSFFSPLPFHLALETEGGMPAGRCHPDYFEVAMEVGTCPAADLDTPIRVGVLSCVAAWDTMAGLLFHGLNQFLAMGRCAREASA
ncbi:unnamed protein product, partial [Symbiodinium sp. KB8]